jgi:hypothetical protein
LFGELRKPREKHSIGDVLTDDESEEEGDDHDGRLGMAVIHAN